MVPALPQQKYQDSSKQETLSHNDLQYLRRHQLDPLYSYDYFVFNGTYIPIYTQAPADAHCTSEKEQKGRKKKQTNIQI